MTTLAHDTTLAVAGPRAAAALGLALPSSATRSACPARWPAALLDSGWSAGAIVLVRIGIAALVVAPFGVMRCAAAGTCCGATPG